jgi:long-chain acyl-CoA synthetase
MKTEERRIRQESIPWHRRLLYGLGNWLVYGPLRDHLGLRRIRLALTGGAPIGPEVFLFFRGLGVNLKQAYGLTETCVPVAVQRDQDVKLDTVGPPVPEVEVRISQEGEVLFKGPGLFQGYYKNTEATVATLRDGWLATGDAGFLDPDGHVAIIDRAKDVSRLLDGTVFAPQYIENKLKFSPYIKEAVAIGQGRPFVAAMINIDMATVGNWAEKRGIPFAGYSDLSQKPQVYDLVYQEVQRVNESLPQEVEIKRFVVLHKELDPDDAEVTRTRKLRRGFVAQKYANIIESLYSEAKEVRVKALITFEDGRTAEVDRTLGIRDVAGVETAVSPR